MENLKTADRWSNNPVRIRSGSEKTESFDNFFWPSTGITRRRDLTQFGSLFGGT